MKNKSKVIAGIVTLMILLISTTTVSAAVFSGLENEETIWTDTGTTTVPEPINPIILSLKIFLILIIVVSILINYYEDDKGLTVGYVIAESSAVISLMFLIVGIKILDLIFIVSAIVVLIILLKLAIDDKKHNKILRE